MKTWLQATLSSRYMRWTGYIVLAFVAYHLAQFTIGVGPVRGRPSRRISPLYTMTSDYRVLGFTAVRAGTPVFDVRSMVILGFQNTIVSIFYIVAVGLLSLHLLHGADSLFQTLGWRNAPLVARIACRGDPRPAPPTFSANSPFPARC